MNLDLWFDVSVFVDFCDFLIDSGTVLYGRECGRKVGRAGAMKTGISFQEGIIEEECCFGYKTAC